MALRHALGRAPEDQRPRQAAVQLLERYGGRYGKHAVALAAAGQLATPAYKWLRHKSWRESYVITVGGTDDIYPDLHEWALARIPQKERRAMLLETDRLNGRKTHNVADRALPSQVRLRYDGSRVQKLDVEGHAVHVSVSRDEVPGGRENIPDNWRRAMERITFSCASMAGRDAVVRMIEGLAAAKVEDDQSPLLMPARWGGEWSRHDDFRPRSLESVVLKEGRLEGLVADLERFMHAEEDYVRLCQPWHRGYLFHGVPGTGKTSAAKALAYHFQLPVYYLPLGDLERDANLMALVQQVGPRSMLLIEDADVYYATTERADKEGQVSLAAMLNALDGVWTPHGLVTVLTTNSVESLDDALLRVGRIDKREEFGMLDADQVSRLVEYADGAYGFDPFEYVGHSPAELMEALRADRMATMMGAVPS